ncbi:GxxExxY protein [Flavilitoribacter nigricans]|uniref:GxxExxY protein n=1 Tax=Flavilitoribacter nigricans (strain ATCC 23147 / DSM 23189 / NBRC 102662 / NCIMB 1420 / SS-2) TaxID=1122177 RepID=A0A2D0MWL6_FLAN2|nr:GxxExxY protein [Flavilitoribacter nigricans]PHN00538.1 GxxExxY protein [Flavilitoribacter nigricans DSM 23189 = NBRC 102662]
MKNEITAKQIVDAAYHVHRFIGPGLLESVYQACLIEELRERRLEVESEVYLPVRYKGKPLDLNFRLDILVEQNIVLELKSVEILLPIHQAQLISYLKLSGFHLGFLINFNVPLIKNGIKRIVHNY